MLAPLRQRNFARLWFGQLISSSGDWMLFIALPFYVYRLTGSALATGIMFVAQTAPRVVLGSAAGVFVDRWNRKAIMLFADVSRALILLPLLFVHSSQWLWLIYVIVCLQATLSQFFTPAKGAVIPRIVADAQLTSANSLSALSDSITRLVMPPLGGALLGLLGLTSVVLIDSGSFLVSAVMIFLLVIPPASRDAQDTAARPEPIAAATPAKARAGFWHDWFDGMRLVKRERVIAGIFVVAAIASIAEGLFNVLFLIFVKVALHRGAVEYGWLTAAQGAGGLIGALLVAQFGKRIRQNLLIGVGGVVNGLLLLTLFNFPSLIVALALVTLTGLPTLAFFIGMQTLLQRTVDDAYLGRIVGIVTTIIAVMMVVGQALASALTDRLGVTPLLDLLGSLNVVAGILALILLRGARSVSHVTRNPQDDASAVSSALIAEDTLETIAS